MASVFQTVYDKLQVLFSVRCSPMVLFLTQTWFSEVTARIASKGQSPLDTGPFPSLWFNPLQQYPPTSQKLWNSIEFSKILLKWRGKKIPHICQLLVWKNPKMILYNNWTNNQLYLLAIHILHFVLVKRL